MSRELYREYARVRGAVGRGVLSRRSVLDGQPAVFGRTTPSPPAPTKPALPAPSPAAPARVHEALPQGKPVLPQKSALPQKSPVLKDITVLNKRPVLPLSRKKRQQRGRAEDSDSDNGEDEDEGEVEEPASKPKEVKAELPPEAEIVELAPVDEEKHGHKPTETGPTPDPAAGFPTFEPLSPAIDTSLSSVLPSAESPKTPEPKGSDSKTEPPADEPPKTPESKKSKSKSKSKGETPAPPPPARAPTTPIGKALKGLVDITETAPESLSKFGQKGSNAVKALMLYEAEDGPVIHEFGTFGNAKKSVSDKSSKLYSPEIKSALEAFKDSAKIPTATVFEGKGKSLTFIRESAYQKHSAAIRKSILRPVPKKPDGAPERLASVLKKPGGLPSAEPRSRAGSLSSSLSSAAPRSRSGSLSGTGGS